MDRRTFVRGTFGLMVVSAGAGIGGLAGCGGAKASKMGGVLFTTPAAGEPETASGPLMMAGIDLIEAPADERVVAYYGDTELFRVDETGAALVMLADGQRTIDDIVAAASSLGHAADKADVALFFSSLGQAGYLRNRILVSILEPVS